MTVRYAGFAKQMREQRLALGLRQLDLGQKTGMGKNRISDFETGNRQMTWDQGNLIADKLGIPFALGALDDPQNAKDYVSAPTIPNGHFKPRYGPGSGVIRSEKRKSPPA